MGKIVINGGRRLDGELKIQGSKNSVLPILAACVLCDGVCVVKNCPDISDVKSATEIIESLGGKISRQDDTLIIDATSISNGEIPKLLMQKMRSSVMFLGPVLARVKNAVIYTPGGCEIGARPIDIHINALKKLGAEIKEEGEKTSFSLKNPIASYVHLSFPSVGATENAMMSAVFTDGITKISNPAMEPEITELQNFINKMGGKISGAGTKLITVEGVKKLKGAEYTITGDRIVCATYLFGVATAGGDVSFCGVSHEDLDAVISVLKEMDCKMSISKNNIRLTSDGKLKAVSRVRTQVFPGFPTDAQAPLTTALSVAQGTSVVREEIFENRFRHASELNKMGADIRIDNGVLVICGVKKLVGTSVYATELRGAGALCMAGLCADGKTEVYGTEYLDRGYEKIERALSMIGADIKREG